MKFRLLRNFVTIAELSSLSRAAEKLFMAQPPLSAQLKQFEEKLGITLFIRQPRGMKLTPAGESLYQDAREILARVDQAVERAKETQSGRHACLRLGLVPSTTHSILPVVLERIRSAELKVCLQVSSLTSSQQLRALRNDEIDIGFARVDEDDMPAEVIAALDDPYCLAIPRSSSLAQEYSSIQLRDAASEPFIGFSAHRDAAYRDRTLALCAEAGFDPDIQHVGGGWSSILSLVEFGLGVGIVPASFSTLAPTGVVFRRIASTRHQGRLVIIRSPRLAADAWTSEVSSTAAHALLVLSEQIQRFGSEGLIAAPSKSVEA